MITKQQALNALESDAEIGFTKLANEIDALLKRWQGKPLEINVKKFPEHVINLAVERYKEIGWNITPIQMDAGDQRDTWKEPGLRFA